MILAGWKEIGGHLRCAPRTAQRRERSGLPVKRAIPGRRSHVIADSELLDAGLRDTEFWRNQDFDRLTHIHRGRTLRVEVRQSRQKMLAKVAALQTQAAAAFRAAQRLTQRTLSSEEEG